MSSSIKLTKEKFIEKHAKYMVKISTLEIK